jgi:hypothetical protein
MCFLLHSFPAAPVKDFTLGAVCRFERSRVSFNAPEHSVNPCLQARRLPFFPLEVADERSVDLP